MEPNKVEVEVFEVPAEWGSALAKILKTQAFCEVVPPVTDGERVLGELNSLEKALLTLAALYHETSKALAIEVSEALAEQKYEASQAAMQKMQQYKQWANELRGIFCLRVEKRFPEVTGRMGIRFGYQVVTTA